MFAHSWALYCLATLFSLPLVAGEARVTVLLQNKDSAPDRILSEMKVELNSLMERAGFAVEWRGAQASTAAVNGDLVVVELRGSCEPPSVSIPGPGILQLGSSAVADGKILPFSRVDCTALAQFLEPHLNRDQKKRREPVYGKALARVLAHEFYHVLGHTADHTARGLTKARIQASDLLDDGVEFGNVPTAALQARGAME